MWYDELKEAETWNFVFWNIFWRWPGRRISPRRRPCSIWPSPLFPDSWCSWRKSWGYSFFAAAAITLNWRKTECCCAAALRSWWIWQRRRPGSLPCVKQSWWEKLPLVQERPGVCPSYLAPSFLSGNAIPRSPSEFSVPTLMMWRSGWTRAFWIWASWQNQWM